MSKAAENHFELTANGRLKNLSDWNEEAARWLAQRDGLELTDAHWEIIRLMRQHYEQYNIPPVRKLLKKEIRKNLSAEKSEDDYLDRLFPNSVLVQGTRIAGLPIPMVDAEIEEMHYSRKVKPAEKPQPAKERKYFIDSFSFEGKQIQVHEKGNLVNMDDWSEALAEFLARKEGLELTPEHWEVIHHMRKFYFQYGITPMVRLLMKNLRDEINEAKASSDYLYKLFPGGPSRQGSRIAGLPEPQGCIDE